MQLEYDEAKNQKNLVKHGMSFQTASRAFDDPQAVIIYDEEHSEGEERYNLIGAVDNHILFIVYTMRREVVRLISARLATKREIERYYENR